mgnify:CR=1 FL=1
MYNGQLTSLIDAVDLTISVEHNMTVANLICQVPLILMGVRTRGVVSFMINADRGMPRSS